MRATGDLGTGVRSGSPSAPGLTSEEVAARLAADGPNTLPEDDGPNPLRALGKQLTHLLALLLWVAAALALLAGMPQLAAAIVVIVLLNGGFAFWQEYRADRSAQQLRTLMPSRVRVVRDGVLRTVDAADLVRGDLVRLAAGDRVAADMRLTAQGLRLDESLMTGESRPAHRTVGEVLVTGSFVVEGEGEAQVTATGSATALAGIASLAGSADRPPSPLTHQLDKVVRVVALLALVTGSGLGLTSYALGLSLTEAFLFGVGVTVALVPEGLLPTVTLSLARGAQLMARRQALVRRLDAVETLGATSYICTDKTGTLTQNKMEVVEVATPHGSVMVVGEGYSPEGLFTGATEARAALRDIVDSARACVSGHVLLKGGRWQAEGDPMEAAIDCLARRLSRTTTGADPADVEVPAASGDVRERRPFTSERLRSAAVTSDRLVVLGAPEVVLARCERVPDQLVEALRAMTSRGRRVLAVAARHLEPGDAASTWPAEERLTVLGLLGIEDPPRDGVADALLACRRAEIRIAMVTGDHAATARAIATELGLLGPDGLVVESGSLPPDDDALGALLDRPGGVVVARVTPDDKFRIARALRSRGHVVAMTGDGVNDAAALREAQVGVAMGASGSDVAREAADLVLLDDHFGTIVTAIELGRSTFQNIRRFLTYHLTDNVAELTPFAVWALSGGQYPLALGVLQVLALDIGTDMLPALALGAEPPNRRVLRGRHLRDVVDRVLLLRATLVLGATEGLAAMVACTVVLLQGGWSWGEEPATALLATASGTAFAVVAVAQMANALACRSSTRPVWRLDLRTNPAVLAAVAAEAVLLLVFLGVPWISELLGGALPDPVGWLMAAAGGVALLVADGAAKRWWLRPSAGRGR